MSTVNASCPTCGPVTTTTARVRLVVATVPYLSYYEFPCDTCHDTIRKPADGQAITILTAGGVVAQRWVIPAEATEPHTGPVICYDDVLDFALNLERVDHLAAVLKPVRGGGPS